MQPRLDKSIDKPVIIHILSYNDDQLHHLVSKRLSEYAAGGKKKESDKYLPISLLIKMNIFREYSAVCFSNRFKSRICSISAQVGNLSALQWTRNPNFSDGGDALSPSSSNSLITQYISCPWDSDTCSTAACYGHLEILQWARSQGCPWNSDTCAYAAREGHLEILQWAINQGCPWDNKE